MGITKHFDILQLIWGARGGWGSHSLGYTLGECGERCLGIAKSGDALMAPELARQGRWNELIDYCIQDVNITRKLALYIQKNGGVLTPEGDPLPLDLPDWLQDLTI